VSGTFTAGRMFETAEAAHYAGTRRGENHGDTSPAGHYRVGLVAPVAPARKALTSGVEYKIHTFPWRCGVPIWKPLNHLGGSVNSGNCP